MNDESKDVPGVPVPSTGRRDLQDLRKLSRMPIGSYVQKQAPPPIPRDEAEKKAPATYPFLAAFMPTRIGKWLWEYFSHRIGPRHPFLTYDKSGADQGIYPIEGNEEVRIALAGDWGTGTDEAAHVGKLMCEFKPHYSIHLGDVYYVGGPNEVGENFLGMNNPANGYTPTRWPAGSNGSFAMNGNHEMYARGIAYFDRILPQCGLISNGKPLGQKTSFFCLENEHWRIIALDTGYDSIGWPLVEYVVQLACALVPEQIEWLRNVVFAKHDDPRGIILLTHHQYYSRYDDQYPKQAVQLAEFISRPVLWFWGHEHRMAIYREHGVEGGIRAFGRCIGHGGMPVDLPPTTPRTPKQEECIVEFTDTRPYPNDENLTVGFNGYAQMLLRGNQATINYVDVHGAIVFSESWVTEAENLRRTDASDLFRPLTG
jgi:hypothetical protein